MKHSPTRRTALAAVLVVLAVLVIVFWFVWWRRPPQMGADEEVFKTVDALFTAVTSRDENRLADCEQRLVTLEAAGKLPPEARVYLDKVIRKARGGNWESAAQTLYVFMRAQRREGANAHSAPIKAKGRARKGPGDP
jgi:hypothetical protein